MASVYTPQVPPQAVPVVPVYQSQTQSSQDPLFEALVKYVTQGPGPSSVSATDIQSIIDSHTSHPDGRAYLQSIVASSVEEPLRIYKNSLDVAGFLSTNLTSWTAIVSGFASGGISFSVNFRASGQGLYMMQVQEFRDAKFFWNDFSGSEIVYPQITVKGSQVHIEIFQGEVRSPEVPPIAEISFPAGDLKLPPVSFGKGPLSIAQ